MVGSLSSLPMHGLSKSSMKPVAPSVGRLVAYFGHVESGLVRKIGSGNIVKGGSFFQRHSAAELEWIFFDLRKTYRQMAAKAHPDNGGTHEESVAVNVAWASLRQSFARHCREIPGVHNADPGETVEEARQKERETGGSGNRRPRTQKQLEAFAKAQRIRTEQQKAAGPGSRETLAKRWANISPQDKAKILAGLAKGRGAARRKQTTLPTFECSPL